MKTYSFTASRAHGKVYENWPGKEVTCSFNSRATAVLLFRKWFGREPTFSWGANFMAECWDNRGNRIEIHQYNDDPGRVRPRAALKHYRWALAHNCPGLAFDWHRELLRIPQLTWTPREEIAA